MSDSKTSSAAGYSLSVILTAIFVTLKLCDKINWSWWWVLSPLWISFLINIVIIGLVVLVVLLTDRFR